MTSDASELGMNVAALKRVDPYVKDILEQATHVALYTFNADNNEWEKTDIEGALFVYSRIGEPYHSILIMNRLSTKNQVEPVTPGLDLQLQEPFLLYKNAKGHIYGIWFYDKDECIRISSMLNKLTKNTDNTNKVTPKTKKVVQKKTNNVDIFSMLSKAQEDFNCHKGGNDERNAGSTNPKSPMSSAIGELSGALTAAMGMTPDGTSKSVMDFFAKATVNKTPSNTEGRTLLERLMSHPTAHTVENIEKQHGSVTPQPTVPHQPQNVGDLLRMNHQSSENSLLTKLKSKMPNQTNVHPQATPKMFSPGYSHQMSESKCRGMELPLNADASTNSSGFLRIQSPTSSGPKKLMSQAKSDPVSNFVGAYEPVSIKKQNSIPGNSVPFDALFQHSQTNNVCEELISPSKASVLASSAAPALIPPGMFAAPSPATTAEPLIRPIEPLTRNQLLQAFNYLLRTDQEFVNKLHEAYVKSMSEILS